ncbi:MAG TPA: response regulator transcription factor [Ignavibacteriaceae bacterium]|nr:response regulator transcription factor [Ignavibacteriaceae bacterium]
MNKIRLLIVEDNRILRESIASMFKKRTDMHVVGNICSGENIVQSIGDLKPDILLIDLILVNQNSLELVKLIREQLKQIQIIMMGLIPTQSTVSEYIETGVVGFILKDADTARFVKTILKVNRGLKVLPPPLTGSLFSQLVKNAISGSNSSIVDKSARMTKRELEVMDLIAEGLTNKEIAQELILSKYTVKSHVHNILAKLSLSTRVQIAKYAYLSESQKSSSYTTSLLEE